MTAYDWLMSIFGLVVGTFLIVLSLDHSGGLPPELKMSVKHRCRIAEADDRGFTVEYEYAEQQYIYTMLTGDFFLRWGFTPETELSEEARMFISRGRQELELLRKKGYPRDYFFRIEKDKEMDIWFDEVRPEKVCRVWKREDAAKRSVNRAFRTMGICILIPVLLIMISKLSG